ncbi:hypothetical protein PsorP6_017013 [Peronosclerospora sorghi]|uniref:Uncharacterized protein n=1 Tax=Peronosclerospora sorghi TaxID=230839 RepID=A0ACC0WEJ6_9STRA|nr:hypothetical protein PsorP6_017013 [Peronosclerospora sorghi]
MLASVCIEYCALIGRTDLLFGEIYTHFKDANKLEVLKELQEPYILAEKLRNRSPVAMEEFVRYFSRQGKLAQVEQCLLHLNVAELDLDTVLKLCRDNELYSALIYIYNECKDDYTTPIEVLLEAYSDAKTSRANFKSKSDPKRKPTEYFGMTFCVTNRNTTSKLSIAEPAGLSSREKDEEATLRGPLLRRSFGYKLLLTFPKHEEISPLKLGKVRSQIATTYFKVRIMGRMFDTPSVEFEGEKKRGMGPPTSRYDSAQNAEMTMCPSRLSIVLSLAEVIFGPKSPFGSTRLLSSGYIEPQEYADARAEAIGDAGSAGGASMMHSLMNFLDLGPASLLLKDSSAVTVETSQEEGFDKAGREAMLIRLLTKLNKMAYNHEALLASVIK